MPKRFIKRYLPDHRSIRKHKHLQFLGDRLHDPNIWHLNRRSVAGALGMGVFVSFIPIPVQMIIAAVVAVWMRVNLPLAVAAVWITNPVTIPPVFFFTYKVGVWMLNSWPLNLVFELSPTDDWLLKNLGAFGGPLLLGSLTVGAILGLLTYGAVRLAWRIYVVALFRRRRRKLANARLANRV